MPLRVTIDRVRIHSLAKQLLLPTQRGKDVASVVKQVGPLRARPTITPYLALWARMDSFWLGDLDAALYKRRSLVRIPCLRAHLHIIPSDELVAYYQATRDALDDGVDSYMDYLLTHARSEDGEPIDVKELIPRVLEIVNTRGACTVDELIEWLPPLATRLSLNVGDAEAAEFRLGDRLIPAMCAQGQLVHAEPSGSWRSDVDRYASLGTWLPMVRLDELTAREALRRVVRAYIAAFGPATVGDVVHWLGGVRRRQVVRALMDLGSEVTRVEVLDGRGELFVLAKEVPELVSAECTTRFVRLLPPRDGTLMAYRDVSRFVEPIYYDRVYDWAGESHGVVLSDGMVAGVWRLQAKTERVLVRLFRKVDPEAMAMIGEEARRLGLLIADEPLDVEVRLDEDESERDAYISLPVNALGSD